MLLDLSTPFGARVAHRLRTERIIWLVTVAANGTPQPSPVWFLWDGAAFLIYSRPNAPKLRHIRRSPRVALHLDGDGLGGDIVIFTGEARIEPEYPPADAVPAYVEKNTRGLERIRLSAPQFAERYSVAIRVTPTGLRGH